MDDLTILESLNKSSYDIIEEFKREEKANKYIEDNNILTTCKDFLNMNLIDNNIKEEGRKLTNQIDKNIISKCDSSCRWLTIEDMVRFTKKLEERLNGTK